MKWIGQHIWDFVSRFRNDVYLEDIADGTVASDKFLGLDSNNKVVKEAVSSGGIAFDGSTANGIATSMNIPENLQGNAPNSTKNAFSINMTETNRETSVPS